MEKKKFDFEAFSKKAAYDLRAGKPMVGQDRVFTPLLKMLIGGALNGEIDAHLSTTKEFIPKTLTTLATPLTPLTLITLVTLVTPLTLATPLTPISRSKSNSY